MQKKSRKIRNLVIGSLAFIFLANYSYKLVHGDKKARQILNNHLDSIMHTENVVAHRGFSSLFPDNSKESIMSALNSPCVDMIEIDIINHRIELLVSDDVLEERRKAFKPKLPVVNGYLKKYASMVTSANTGAVLKVKE